MWDWLGVGEGQGGINELVCGACPVGVLMASGMSLAGVKDVSLVDIDESRLVFAESFGFKGVASGSDTLSAMHHGVDLVADATGVPAVAGTLTNYIANGGVGLFFGVCPQNAKIEIAPFELFRRQITLAGSHSLNHNIPQALEGLRAYGDDIARVVSHRMSIDEIAGVFGGKAPKGSLKIQFTKR